MTTSKPPAKKHFTPCWFYFAHVWASTMYFFPFFFMFFLLFHFSSNSIHKQSKMKKKKKIKTSSIAMGSRVVFLYILVFDPQSLFIVFHAHLCCCCFYKIAKNIVRMEKIICKVIEGVHWWEYFELNITMTLHCSNRFSLYSFYF